MIKRKSSNKKKNKFDKKIKRKSSNKKENQFDKKQVTLITTSTNTIHKNNLKQRNQLIDKP